jgi:hypothetical protein
MPNKRLHQTITSVTPCANAQAAPNAHAGEANVRKADFILDIVWDGITNESTLSETGVTIRHALADAAKSYNWAIVLNLLADHPELVNSTRLGGRSLYTSLHQAAHGEASADIVAELIRLGSFRTLRTVSNETPLEIATRFGRHELFEMLTPMYRHHVPHDAINRLQELFHQVIRGRAGDLVAEHSLRLPVLEPLLELEEPSMWFAVPGMYGGFSYKLERAGKDPALVSESWCRVVGGSGQRHTVTLAGAELSEEGFA